MEEPKIKQKRFEVVQENPDVRIKVFGASPKEIFSNSLLAMAHVQKPSVLEPSTVGKILGTIRLRNTSETILVESMDYETLLIDFLEQALELSDEKGAVFSEIKFKELSEQKLFGKLYGVKANLDKDIKSVVFDEMYLKNLEDGNWEALLVFEV